MLKFKKKKYQSNFTKKNIKNTIFIPKKNLIFLKNKLQIQIKKLLFIFKKIKKRFKKRKLVLFINFKNNFIKSYKSKNARMGKGKGSLKKYSIIHYKRNIGLFNWSKANFNHLIKKFKNILI